MKHLLLTSFFLCLSYSGYSQDVIVKKDGSTILSKVLEVSSSEVKYKKYSNQDGPIYSIPNSYIQVINFENGDREDFGKERYDSGVSVKKKVFKGWNTVYFQYNPSYFNFTVLDKKWDEPSSFTGITLGYSHAFNIVPGVPVFFELGAAIQYSFNTKITPLTDDKNVQSGKMELENPWFLSIKVPLNITYKFSFPNTNLALAPYLGLQLRFNAIGFVKAEYTERAKVIYKNTGSSSDWMDNYDDNWFIFSKKDMGDEYAWKTFQVGWHIGANFFIGDHFVIGASYGSDFSDIFKYPEVSAKISTVSATLGYVF